MSTRTRIVLKYPSGGQTCGSRAVFDVVNLTKSIDGRLALKYMKQRTKAEKLLYLGQQLPAGYALSLVQEPRHTRKNRSLYWKQREGGPV